MSMILNKTNTGVVVDWEDKISMKKYIDDCWKAHLDGNLTIKDGEIATFTRRNLTRQMVELFDKVTESSSSGKR